MSSAAARDSASAGVRRSNGACERSKVCAIASPPLAAGPSRPSSRSPRLRPPVALAIGESEGAALADAQRAGDAVSMARALLANPRLPKDLRIWDGPDDPPCSLCNRYLVNVLEHPLACYHEQRFANRGGYDAMIAEAMSIFESDTGFA